MTDLWRVPSVPLAWIQRGNYRIDEHGYLEKRCRHCLDYFPADTEFFYRGRNSDRGRRYREKHGHLVWLDIVCSLRAV